MRLQKPRLAGALVAAALVTNLWVPSVPAAPADSAAARGAPKQNDARSKRDAGNTFDEATKVKPRGYYEGKLDSDGGDTDDFYKFSIKEGGFLSVLVEVEGGTTDPITLLDPSGNIVDVGTRYDDVGVTASQAFTSEIGSIRLAVHKAVVGGQYRLHLQSDQYELGEYSLCFMNCEEPLEAGIEMIFGGALYTADARVLLVPPTHGDLGNPLGPTVADYLDATLKGINAWTEAMDKFAKDYPQYDYIRDIDFHIEIFDEADPVDPVGYDVILGYVAAGPAFRGVAADASTREPVNAVLRQVGIEDQTRYSGRVIALSLFGSAPRAGQVTWDFPELTDLQIVTTHEFGHTFGLGHTRTWHPKLGPDLMNSPAPFIYGDGFALGDGGEHTKMKCLTSLNLYGMAHLYRWLPSGEWEGSDGSVELPKGIPYRWYC